MEALFQELLKGTDATPEMAAAMAHDFSSVALVALLGGSAGKLNDDDHVKLGTAWRDERYHDVLQIIRAKYRDDEWAGFVKSCVGPLIRDYHESVIAKQNA
jgi:hypothetical protein